MLVVVEEQLSSKYWSHPIISLPCYMSCLNEEIGAGEEFEMLYFENENEINYVYAFQTRLYGIESTTEALKMGKSAVNALEKRIRHRILNKVKHWAESF